MPVLSSTTVASGKVVRDYNLMATLDDFLIRAVGLAAFNTLGLSGMYYNVNDNTIVLSAKQAAVVAAIDEIRFLLHSWGVRTTVLY